MHTYHLYLLTLVLGAFPAALLAAPQAYTGEASVLIAQDDQATARGRAIDGALREALERAVASLVDGQALVSRRQALESRMYARPWSYVRSYRLLWEYPDGPYYRVVVEAEFALSSVRQALANLGVAISAPAPSSANPEQEDIPPWVLVLVTERSLGQNTPTWPGSQGVVTRVFRSRLQRQGIRLRRFPAELKWDGQDHSALTTARQLGVKAVLIGRAGVQEVYSAGTGAAVQASAYIQALDAATGEAFALERAEATVLQDDKSRANTQALEQVAAALVNRVLPALQTFQQRKIPRTAPIP